MTRHLFGFACVCALGFLPLVGCGDNNGGGGSGGTAGTGGTGGSTGQAFPCTEQGIRDAIAEGGGPHTFACSGPTTVVTDQEIVIDRDVMLDGGGNLRVDGDSDHTVFSVAGGVRAELEGIKVTGGNGTWAGGIHNNEDGLLILVDCTVSGNTGVSGGGISSLGQLTILHSTISGNTANIGGGILNSADDLASIQRSTISGNTADFNGGAIANNRGLLILQDVTIAANQTVVPLGDDLVTGGTVSMRNTLFEGTCTPVPVDSEGGNIESPGNTCGLDESEGDQIDISPQALGLGPLQDNGGLTETHGLREGSVAIDAVACINPTDQRGVSRPQGVGCDVGAFELEQ